MKKSFWLTFLCAQFTSLLAQPKWGLEWNFFTSTYVFETEFDDKQKLNADFIRDMAVDANGDVWISSGISFGNSYSAGSTPATAPDPGYEIKKEIEAFDPSGGLVVFKKK